MDKSSDSDDTGTCSTCDTQESDTNTDTDSDSDSDSDTDLGGVTPVQAVRVVGYATWTLEFDETAESAGFTDCSYSRSYEGLQYLDQPYLCPDCDVQTGGTATMTEGDECFAQISSAGPERYEAWGFSQAGFFRGAPENRPMGQLAEIALAGEGEETEISWSSEYELTDGGLMDLSASGGFTWTIDPNTEIIPPEHSQTGDYACGWPQNDPGNLVLDYTLADGSVFPNAYLRDQCDEEVAIWDLYGRYLVFDNTQPDCGPCRSMADTSEAFIQDMADQGIEVMMVSLMGNGLSEPWVEPSLDTVESWVTAYALESPVLADRGFGYGLMPPYFDNDYGFPAWMVVAPDMTIIQGGIGFGSWDTIESIVLGHAGN